jgi:hypothetical protein
MPALGDLERVSNLYLEWRTIDQALDNFDNGGVIVSMMISGGPNLPPMAPPGPAFGPPRMAVSVSTVGMTYPQQMVDGIKAQFTARKTAIAQELTQLGITDVPAAAAARR